MIEPWYWMGGAIALGMLLMDLARGKSESARDFANTLNVLYSYQVQLYGKGPANARALMLLLLIYVAWLPILLAIVAAGFSGRE